MNIIQTLIHFARLKVSLMLWMIVFIGSSASGEINELTYLSIILLISWYIHATTINDYSDILIDKLNFKDENDRPLLGSKINLNIFWIIHIIVGFLSILLSTFYGFAGIAITFIMLFLNYVYSVKPFRLSDRGIYAILLLATSYTIYPLSLGFISNNKPIQITLALSLFIGFCARLLLKDFRDEKGDKEHNKLTFLIRNGKIKTILTSALLWIISSIVIIIYAKNIGFMIIVIIGLCMILYLLYNSIIADKDKTILNSIFVSKSANIILLCLLFFMLLENVQVNSSKTNIYVVILGTYLYILNLLRYVYYSKITT